MPSDLRAVVIMRNNIRTLLAARKDTDIALAKWVRKSKSWISKFLKGQRQMQLKDLDRVADFFGLATYQLFQPGIGSLTERRVQERRKRPDRRIGHAGRELDYMREQVSPILLKLRGKLAKKALQTQIDPAITAHETSKYGGRALSADEKVQALEAENRDLRALVAGIAHANTVAGPPSGPDPQPHRSTPGARPRAPKHRRVAN